MNRLVRLIFLLLMSGGSATAQNQYVSILNYHSPISVSPVVFTPGVSWVNGDNSAFDVNHHRFFFQGGKVPQAPWNLYAVDVNTGAVLVNTPVPSNNLNGGLVYGLQYDSGADTLYATYYDGSGNVYLSWIEIATGIVHPIRGITGLAGYVGSTFDLKDHLYILYNDTQLISLDTRTGFPVYFEPITATGAGNVFDLVYNNSDSRLYGLTESGSAPAFFNWFELATGTVHPLGMLPVEPYPNVLNSYSIDEAAGNFIFISRFPSGSDCVHYKLYTVSIGAGMIVDSSLFPYAEDPSNPLDSNLLEFSFDNQHGRLYALNWRPTLQTIPAIISISAGSNPACAGQSERFTATLSSVFDNSSYQWQLNGQPAAGNTPIYTDNNPNDGDSIRCIVTASTACGSVITDTSSSIVLAVRPVVPTAVGISSSANNICAGDTVDFQATPVNGGDNPQFQWQVNGVSAGGSGDTFSAHTLADGDSINCIMNGSQACSAPAAADKIVMVVRPVPGLEMPRDTVIARGQGVRLSPFFQGSITSYQWQPVTALDNPAGPDPVASPLNTTTYGLKITADDGCSVTGKVTISVFTPLRMPNAFSPNGDGRNDVFRIPPSVSIQLVRISVYDRWGAAVFVTGSSSEGWDGKIGGKPAPAGPYVWVVEYRDPFTGKRLMENGIVILVR